MDPDITQIDDDSIHVNWTNWDQNVDYGNGPIASYRLYYAVHAHVLSDFVDSINSNAVINNLQPGIEYDIAVSALRSVDGTLVEGKVGNVISGTTFCLGKV